MSPRASQKKPPIASRRKRAVHLFYLAQPFLQFVALMAILLVLGRCSPLASSTDKGAKMVSASSLASPHTEQAIKGAEDEDIHNELTDVRSADELAVIKQSDFTTQVAANALDAEKASSLTDVQGLFRAHAQHGLRRNNVRLLVLRLTKEQRDAFFQAGSVRVNLAEALAGTMAPDVRHAYFAELHKLMHGDLTAKAYLILADEDMASPDAVNTLPVAPKFQLAIFPNDEKAYLDVAHSEPALDDQQQKLIESNKDKALSLALVLQ